MQAKVAQATRALQAKAHRLFEATAKKKRSYREDGQRVVPSRLWRPNVGDYRVFVEKTEKVRVNTAVQILVDVSTSMETGDRLDIARTTAFATAAALSRIQGIALASATFPASGAYGDDDSELVSVLSEFGERPELNAARFAAASSRAYTPTPEALLWAGDRLLRRKETRKVVFVMTDGFPERPRHSGHVQRTIEIRRELENLGIEVIGIGIDTEIKHVFPRSVMVSDINQLAGKVFEVMEDTLLKAA